MTERIWVGVDGNFQTASNWNPSGAPADSDILHFTGDSQQDVNAGLSNPLLDDIELNIHNDYTGTIASTGSKLDLGGSSTPNNIRFNGRGSKLFITGTFTDVICEAALGTTDFLEIDGTVTNLYFLSCAGSASVTSAAAVTNIDVHNSPSFLLTVNTGVTALARLRMVNAGRVLLKSNVTSGNGLTEVYGGILEATDAADFTTMTVGWQGKVLHKSKAASGNSIDNLFVMSGGLFDGRLNRNASNVTIANAFVFPGARLILKNALDNYDATVTALGGSYQYELGKTAVP